MMMKKSFFISYRLSCTCPFQEEICEPVSPYIFVFTCIYCYVVQAEAYKVFEVPLPCEGLREVKKVYLLAFHIAHGQKCLCPGELILTHVLNHYWNDLVSLCKGSQGGVIILFSDKVG